MTDRIWVLIQRGSQVTRRVLETDTSIADLKHMLLEDHPEWSDFDIVYNDCVVLDDRVISEVFCEGDQEPCLFIRAKGDELAKKNAPSEDVRNNGSSTYPAKDDVNFEPPLNMRASTPDSSNFSVKVRLRDQEYNVNANTLSELRTWANRLCKQSDLILCDMKVSGHALPALLDSLSLQEVLAGAADKVVVLEVASKSRNFKEGVHKNEGISDSYLGMSQAIMGQSALNLMEEIFHAQYERDRVAHINQLTFNSRILNSSFMALGNIVAQDHPQLYDEFLGVMARHDDATKQMEKLLKFLNGEVLRTGNASGSRQNADPVRSRTATPAIPQNDFRRPILIPQGVDRPAVRNAPVHPRANPQPPNAAGQAMAGVAARVPRVAALIVIDLRLLFKLAIIVAVLGQDAGQKEFYIILTLALIVYLASTNMLRLPFGDLIHPARFGRIPPANRRGFFVDLWTMIITFFLSIIPVWQVVPDEPAQQQVRPVEAQQPNMLPPGGIA